MDKKEQTRLRVQRYRDKEKSVTKDNDVTHEDVTQGTVEMFEGKPRFLTLSDGQVLDRTYRPNPNKHIPEMIAANRVNESRLGKGTDTEKAAKVLMVINAMDKDVTGLDGKKVNLLTMVRRGVDGQTLAEIKSGWKI